MLGQSISNGKGRGSPMHREVSIKSEGLVGYSEEKVGYRDHSDSATGEVIGRPFERTS
jgi:hypothetical protein